MDEAILCSPGRRAFQGPRRAHNPSPNRRDHPDRGDRRPRIGPLATGLEFLLPAGTMDTNIAESTLPL